MTEQEQIKKWEEDFCEFAKNINSEILVYEGNLAWQAFLYAKRSQPIVKLPKVDYGLHIMASAGQQTYQGKVENALTAAGIKYTIGE